MRPRDRTVEQVLAELASSAEGLVTRPRLLSAGVTPAEIKSRLRSGLLLPDYRGVYRVGHRAPTLESRYLAAVLACGEGALLAGPAAAHLFGIMKRASPPPEVIAPTERRVPGVVTRRSRRIDPADATVWRSVPVTTVPRTIVDLAAHFELDRLSRACHEAEVLYRLDAAAVNAVLARRPNSPGAAKLRLIFHGDHHVTLSKLERRFLDLLRENGLPLPVTNRVAGGRRVDCRWPEYRLTVELDGFRYHRSRYAWEQDHRGARQAYARGDEFRRYTYGDVFHTPGVVVAELRPLLAVRRAG